MSQKIKPLLRGHFHQAAFYMALGAGAVLVAAAKGFEARVGALIYAASIACMYGISAVYHRITWRPEQRVWWRRLDHAGIFVMIAGTGTPVALLGIRGSAGQNLFWILWISALAGVLKELLWIHAPKWVSAVLYVIMGWTAIFYYQEMIAGIGWSGLSLMLAGGLIYTLGAVIYALRKPDPVPPVFGYHEIFHLLVMVASVCHFVVVFRLVV
jgi:hemolysin III